MIQEISKMLTCETCKWWLNRRVDPGNIKNVTGDCHGGPPAAIVIPMGGGQAQVNFTYPPLPSNFQACRLHEVKVVDLAERNGVKV